MKYVNALITASLLDYALPETGNTNISSHRDIVEAKIVVSAGNVGAGFLGLSRNGRIPQDTTSRTRRRGHAALFIRKLRGANIRKENRIRRGNLPFISVFLKVSHDLPVTADHFTSVVFSHETDRVLEVVNMTSDLERQKFLVEFE